jgi:predicted class III extradiol MEMO1 family dioxygenase
VDVVRDMMVVDAESHTDEEVLLVGHSSDFLHFEVYVSCGNYDNYALRDLKLRDILCDC